MRFKLKWALAAVIVIITLATGYALVQPRGQNAIPEPVSSLSAVKDPTATGRVTMIDLGATECIPCQMMAPIIEELKKEYAGKADIIFIDVWKNPEQARKYNIRAIPTQIFFDAQSREVSRHVGFMDKKRIVDTLTRLGA